MNSREDVVKALLNKRGVDTFSTGGVSILFLFLFFSVYLMASFRVNQKIKVIVKTNVLP